MKQSKLYINLWNNHKKSIKNKLANSDIKQFVQLGLDEFDSVGNRKKYSFNLEYKNGNVSNNIKGSAVARDLDNVLNNDIEIKELLRVGRYKINLDKNFCLWIQKTKNI